MTIDHTVDDMLAGGGKPLSFNGTPPITHRGIVVSAITSQQTDMNKKLKFYDDGKPMMQIVVTIQTAERDDPTDDGMRRLFIKGHAIQALRAALAGKKLEAGGELVLQYFSDKPPTTPGFNPTKLFQAAYRPPTPTQTANDLLATPAPAPAASLPRDFPDPAPAAAPFDPFLDS